MLLIVIATCKIIVKMMKGSGNSTEMWAQSIPIKWNP